MKRQIKPIELLWQWSQLEPNQCLRIDHNNIYKLMAHGGVWHFSEGDFDLPTALMRLQGCVQCAIVARRLRISLDYYPEENVWRASLFPPTDLVNDPDRGWDGEDQEAAIALLQAYLLALVGLPLGAGEAV